MGIFSFFGDIIKQVLVKVITFALIIFLALLGIKFFLGIDVFTLFRG